jgi:apolipoprotein D and lipocalin family protein
MKPSTKIAAATGFALAGALFAAARLRARHPVGNSAVPQPAKAVSINRYVGRWYEIARYEQRFERGCTDVTADYRLRDDGALEVVNTCRRSDASVRVARGVARTVSASNAKLEVRFFGLFRGDYWVLDHAEDYSWSIVGEPSGRYLWILAREPNPGNALVEELVRRAADMGYETSMLVRNIQG